MNHLRTFFIAAVGSGLLACSPEDRDPLEGVGARDGGAEPSAYAVVSGDYTTTSVGLLEADGTLLDDDFVNSGSASAGLVTALSGDVILPTRSGDPGVLALIDRFRTDVITRIEIESGEVLGQVKTQQPNAEDDEAGYSSNPQDYLYIDESTAWVARHDPNLEADADDPDQGIDLFQLEPTEFERTGERIDLHRFDVEAERMNPDTGETEQVTAYARPGRMVRLGDKVVVGIVSASLAFDAAGPGMVALVDLEKKRVEKLELPGLTNCAQVDPVPDDPTRVAVACVGFYLASTRASSGVAVLQLEDDELTIEHIWRAADDDEAAEATSNIVALSATEVVAVETGAAEFKDDDGKVLTPARNDRLFLLDLASGKQELVLEGEGSFVIGSGAYNPVQRILLVPDGSTDGEGKPNAGVRRYEFSKQGELTELDVVEVDDILAPREVKPID